MKRFLVVDDHEVVRRGLKQVLAEAFPGATVEDAATSEAAMAALSGGTWDLLLLDINIPGRSGLELLEDARRLWPSLPVLVVSAYPEEEFAIRSIRLGAAGYLTKTSASAELVAAARKALAGGKYVTAKLAEKLMDVLGGEAHPLPHEALSSRELQVLRLVASGKTGKEIASELHLSEKTIATYRARISDKLGVSTIVELTRYALRHGLVD
jgi:two-component system, NarL family, invasion response regulator UvrY